MKFNFKAKAQDGSIKRGTIDAADDNAAVQILHNNNMVPISVTAIRGKLAIVQKIEDITSRVNQHDLLLFFREFSTLVGAKVPITPALQTIYEQTENPTMQKVIKSVSADIEDGLAISDSFAKHPQIFSPLMISMIKAGEISGNLQGAIQYVMRTTEQNYQLTAKIRGALMYPGFVLTVAGVIGFITITWILPRLTGVIRDLDVEIPWYTQAMMNLGDFMQAYWWVVLVVFFGVMTAMFYYVKTAEGAREWDRIKLKIPVVGELFRYVYLTRFSENLSILIAGGIPIVRALIIIADVVNNSVYKGIILEAAKDVKVGGEISKTFFKHEEIPPMVARMIKVGEDTGRLSDILTDLANFYRGEVDQITRNLSSLIEPVLIVFLGIGVGVLVVSVLLPIYNIAGQI